MVLIDVVWVLGEQGVLPERLGEMIVVNTCIDVLNDGPTILIRYISLVGDIRHAT